MQFSNEASLSGFPNKRPRISDSGSVGPPDSFSEWNNRLANFSKMEVSNAESDNSSVKIDSEEISIESNATSSEEVSISESEYSCRSKREKRVHFNDRIEVFNFTPIPIDLDCENIGGLKKVGTTNNLYKLSISAEENDFKS